MIIKTKRLILRPFQKGDEFDLLEYLKEPCVNCFADMKINTFEEATKAINERIEKQEFYFAIFLQSENKVIGEINASVESSNFVSKINDTFSPCWMLNNNYKGKGYAYEAAVAFFDYLFNVKGARRIYAYTEDYNINSQKLCKKLGMRKEGEFKKFVVFINDKNGNPVYENTWQYAILKEEWKNK